MRWSILYSVVGQANEHYRFQLTSGNRLKRGRRYLATGIRVQFRGGEGQAETFNHRLSRGGVSPPPPRVLNRRGRLPQARSCAKRRVGPIVSWNGGNHSQWQPQTLNVRLASFEQRFMNGSPTCPLLHQAATYLKSPPPRSNFRHCQEVVDSREGVSRLQALIED